MIDRETIKAVKAVDMNIIFEESGDGKETTLSKIKDYASKVKDISSPFLNSFSKWKGKVTNYAVREGFYENNDIIKVIAGIYSVIGFVLVFFHFIFYPKC